MNGSSAIRSGVMSIPLAGTLPSRCAPFPYGEARRSLGAVERPGGDDQLVDLAGEDQHAADPGDRLDPVEHRRVDARQVRPGDGDELLGPRPVPRGQRVEVDPQVLAEEAVLALGDQVIVAVIAQDLVAEPGRPDPLPDVVHLPEPERDRQLVLGRLAGPVPDVDGPGDHREPAGQAVQLGGEDVVLEVQVLPEWDAPEQVDPVELVGGEGVEEHPGVRGDPLDGPAAGEQLGVVPLALAGRLVEPGDLSGDEVGAGPLDLQEQALARVFGEPVVAVEEHDVRRAGGGHPVVARRSAAAAVARPADVADARVGQLEPAHDLLGAVGARVVHDDHFEIPQRLVQHRPHGPGQPRGVVVGDDDHTAVGRIDHDPHYSRE
nr:hypothetical protein GCM10020093_089750 [Planobispora longispora]